MHSHRLRIAAVIALFVALWIAAKASGMLDGLDASHVRALVASWGMWGIAGYLAIFAVGAFAHMPGLVFFAAAILAWGKGTGFAIGYAGALLAVCASFIVVRAIGGRPLAAIERPFVKRLLARLDRRPILSVTALRAVLLVSPSLSYALAMTNVRLGDYAIGSAIGLFPGLALAALLFDWLFQ